MEWVNNLSSMAHQHTKSTKSVDVKVLLVKQTVSSIEQPPFAYRLSSVDMSWGSRSCSSRSIFFSCNE